MSPNRVKMYEALTLLDQVETELTSNRENYLPLKNVFDLIAEYIELLRKEIEGEENVVQK